MAGCPWSLRLEVHIARQGRKASYTNCQDQQGAVLSLKKSKSVVSSSGFNTSLTVSGVGTARGWERKSSISARLLTTYFMGGCFLLQYRMWLLPGEQPELELVGKQIRVPVLTHLGDHPW